MSFSQCNDKFLVRLLEMGNKAVPLSVVLQLIFQLLYISGPGGIGRLNLRFRQRGDQAFYQFIPVD